MRFLILLFPVMVLAQPNFSISKWEYIRRIDNVPYLMELMWDRGLSDADPAVFRQQIIDQKNLSLLQQLEAEGQAKKLEKQNRTNRASGYEIYTAKKYLRNLDINTLTTEEKKKEFFNALKILIGK